MSIRRLPVVSCIALIGCTAMLLGTTGARANEVQLAGIRLGQHAMHVLEVYGQPDGVIKGAGGGGPAAGAAAGGAQGPGGEGGMPGMGPGAGGMGPGAGGPGGGGMGPGGGGMGPGGGMEGMGAEAGMGGLAGAMMAGMGGMMGGQQAAGAPAAAATTGGTSGGLSGDPPSAKRFFRSNVPDWAAPVWIPMQGQETLWVYKKGAVVLGFVLDRDGYVVAIAVAGEKCGFARTAGWAPHRSVKLGDDYKEVIRRYGYPEKSTSYEPGRWVASRGGAGPTVGGGIANASRNLILHYGVAANVEFLLMDMKVVRIHIWEPEMRPPGPGLPGAAAAGTGMGAGEMGGMPGAGGPMGGGAPGGPM